MSNLKKQALALKEKKVPGSVSQEAQKLNVMEVMGLSIDDNVVELDKLKGLLNQASTCCDKVNLVFAFVTCSMCNFTLGEKGREAGINKKARSLNKVGVWEEIEQLYKELETREKDYQVAMAIGKMLLEKNKDLNDQRETLKQQFEEQLRQRDAQITELLQMVEKYTEKKQELQNEVKALRMVCTIVSTRYLV